MDIPEYSCDWTDWEIQPGDKEAVHILDGIRLRTESLDLRSLTDIPLGQMTPLVQNISIPASVSYSIIVNLSKCDSKATKHYRVGEHRVGHRCNEHPPEAIWNNWQEIPLEEAIVLEVMES